MEIILIIIGVIVIAGIVGVVNANEQTKKQNEFLQSKGVDPKSMIDIGTFISGHPDINDQVQNVSIFKDGSSLVIYQRFGSSCNVRGFIPIEKIKNIIVEDQSSFEKRVTLGRVLLVGVFALAWRKKKKNEMYFLVISWNDGKFDHETLFQITGLDIPNNSNTIRNKLIQACK
jgi:hypothetical protein